MQWYWKRYAAEETAKASVLASPLRESELAGLPEAIVVTAEHDVLRDEGEAYAQRLDVSRGPVHRVRSKGQMHGFLMMIGILPGSRLVIELVCGRLRVLAERAQSRFPTLGE